MCTLSVFCDVQHVDAGSQSQVTGLLHDVSPLIKEASSVLTKLCEMMLAATHTNSI